MRIFETFVSVIFIMNGGPGEKVLIKKKCPEGTDGAYEEPAYFSICKND